MCMPVPLYPSIHPRPPTPPTTTTKNREEHLASRSKNHVTTTAKGFQEETGTRIGEGVARRFSVHSMGMNQFFPGRRGGGGLRHQVKKWATHARTADSFLPLPSHLPSHSVVRVSSFSFSFDSGATIRVPPCVGGGGARPRSFTRGGGHGDAGPRQGGAQTCVFGLGLGLGLGGAPTCVPLSCGGSPIRLWGDGSIDRLTGPWSVHSCGPPFAVLASVSMRQRRHFTSGARSR